jgi:hypothetical protein
VRSQSSDSLHDCAGEVVPPDAVVCTRFTFHGGQVTVQQQNASLTPRVKIAVVGEPNTAVTAQF